MASETYRIEVSHPELKTHRMITGKDYVVVQSKAREQLQRWDEQWEKKQIQEEKKRQKEEKLAYEDKMSSQADSMTKEAECRREEIENTLIHTLSVDDCIDWNSLYDHSEFNQAQAANPQYHDIPPKPNEKDFTPQLNVFDRIIPALRKKKERNAETGLILSNKEWNKEVETIDAKNRDLHAEFLAECQQIEKLRDEFYKERHKRNRAIEKKAQAYFSKDPEAVVDYCDLVLSRSSYPDDFPKEWELAIVPETSVIVIDYELPNPSVIPRLKSARFIKSRDEITTSELPESKINSIYDELLYKICLRTIHEIFEADAVDAVESIVFNGHVSAINTSTGNFVRSCVMSLQTTKADFLGINLENVNSKDCFRGLKGVGSAKLHGLAPVPPILQIEKSDSRIVESYSVIDGVDESINLAAMDWEDFEHLIREVFAAEFSGQGGEVHVTQASRDGGVDAIAFDPDPIRGGKIVIQAKRYTGTVGVAAVRDLYGTVVNEGATKGILVTTSNYGPDAYTFSKDKPISLLNGANLLHLLDKHGRRARIDIREAKLELSQQT